MAEETAQIRQHIDEERERLGDDLEEIEHRMKDAMDVRLWYQKHTTSAIGAAVVGGFVLAKLIGGSAKHDSPLENGEARESAASWESEVRKVSRPMSRVGSILDNTVAALAGVAAHKLQDFISDAIPGFREQYANAERRKVG